MTPKPKEIIFLVLLIIGLVLSLVYVAKADEIDDLVPHIIQVESSGNPHAVSREGCVGLMQISSLVFKEWLNNCETKDFLYRNTHIYYMLDEILMHPDKNKKIGTWYLHRIKDHYLKENYTIERMLAAYNGGPSRMRKLLREGKDWQDMPRESVDYVKKIMRLYKVEKL